MKTFRQILIGLIVLVMALWTFGPFERVSLTPNLDTSGISNNLDAYFAARESAYSDITPGVEKRVIWAGEAGARTEWSVVYIHGFSATSEEIRPVPDNVAKGLGANLIFTRLAGHGRSNDAMGEATVQDWINDVSEALSAARAVSDKILIISTSTGGTLVTAAAHNPDLIKNVAGSIFVSPNFGINNAAAKLLTLPASRYWLPRLVGHRRSFEPANAEQEKFWTTEYPSVSVLPVAALVKKVVRMDHSKVTLPALFWFTLEDEVVTAKDTQDVADAWGGPKAIEIVAVGENDDAASHVIAGDILSPDQTDKATAAMLSWAKEL